MTSRRTGPDPKIIGSVLAAVVILTVIAVVIVTSRGEDAPDADTEFGVVEAEGAALVPLPDGGDDPTIGALAPALRSEGPEGIVSIDPSGLDQPAMLVFLAHWCPHCRAELPRLVVLQDGGTFDEIRTVAVLIATDPARPNYPPSDWLAQEGWEGDNLYDDGAGTAARAYGVTSFPFIVFVDKDGRVVQRLSGEQPPGAIEDAVRALTDAG